MNNFKITCGCGHFVTKNDDLYKISYYKVKKPTLFQTEKKERVIEETFYCYVCPECNRDVVVIKRKARNAAGHIKALLPEKLIGLKAVEYLQMTENNRIDKTNTLQYSECGIVTKGIPLRYGKTINHNTQRLRYINECGYDGKRIKTDIKVVND